MEAAFFQDHEGGRAHSLQLLIQSFGCSYICLWSYFPLPSNCLIFLDGLFQEEINTQLPSSSSGSLARRLFEEYRNSVSVLVENYQNVPGYAFKNSFPYLELNELELSKLASNEIQKQFYQEARIKTAVFMGCKSGEIELGWSNVSQINTKTEMIKTWCAESTFPRQSLELQTEIQSRVVPIMDQNPPSSSSSSLKSLSIDSPEYSSILFNIPTTSQIPETHLEIIPPNQPVPTTTMETHQTAIESIFDSMRKTQFPNQKTELVDEAMTRAILAVLSSSPTTSSPTTSSQQQQKQSSMLVTQRIQSLVNPTRSAFKSYNSKLAPRSQISAQLRRQSLLKRSISFFRSLNLIRVHQRLQATRPTSTQMHHMISERKRREKLNENFQVLRSLLPPGTKKDKASLLTSTREYLVALKSEIDELSKRNEQLEAQLNQLSATSNEDSSNLEEVVSARNTSSERVVVRVQRVETTSQESEIIDLQVILRTERSAEDVVVRILELLKQDKNLNLMSIEANTHLTQSIHINHVTSRIRVHQGSDWNETAFLEAVRRVVADLAQ